MIEIILFYLDKEMGCGRSKSSNKVASIPLGDTEFENLAAFKGPGAVYMRRTKKGSFDITHPYYVEPRVSLSLSSEFNLATLKRILEARVASPTVSNVSNSQSAIDDKKWPI